MVLALLVFGPERLPELGRKLGRAMREFRRASDEFRSTVETNLQLGEESIVSPVMDPVAEPSAGTSGATAAETTAAVTEDGGGPGAREPEVTPAENAGAEPEEPYWTRRGGRLLHRATCAWRVRVPEGERIPLKAASDGWDMGLEACPACNPRETLAVL
jgi:TatA/E family protein of Tat protein translocase